MTFLTGYLARKFKTNSTSFMLNDQDGRKMSTFIVETGVYLNKEVKCYSFFSSPCSFQIVSCTDSSAEKALESYLYPVNTEKGFAVTEKLYDAGDYKFSAKFPSVKERKTILIEVRSVFNPMNLYQSMNVLCQQLKISLATGLYLPIHREVEKSLLDELKDNKSDNDPNYNALHYGIKEIKEKTAELTSQIVKGNQEITTVLGTVAKENQEIIGLLETTVTQGNQETITGVLDTIRTENQKIISVLDIISKENQETIAVLDTLSKTPKVEQNDPETLGEIKEHLIHNNVNLQTLTESVKESTSIMKSIDVSILEKKIQNLEQIVSKMAFEHLFSKIEELQSTVKTRTDIPEDFKKLLFQMREEKEVLYGKLQEAENYIEEIENESFD